MSKDELVDLARQYNKSFDKIKNVQKLKKQDLKVELLSRADDVFKVWSGIKKPLEKVKRKVPKLKEEEVNPLIKQSVELGEKIIASKDTAERKMLMKEKEKLDKKILKGL